MELVDKKWNIAKFTRAANYLNSKYDLDIVLCGFRMIMNEQISSNIVMKETF